MTPDDLHEGHRPKFAPGSTVAQYNSIHDKITGPDVYRRDVAFLPLLYDGEVTKLT